MRLFKSIQKEPVELKRYWSRIAKVIVYFMLIVLAIKWLIYPIYLDKTSLICRSSYDLELGNQIILDGTVYVVTEYRMWNALEEIDIELTKK